MNTKIIEIMINDGCQDNPFSFQFKCSDKQMDSWMNEQKAKISFEADENENLDELVTISDDSMLYDALKKLILLHTIKFSRGLSVDRIDIFVDGKPVKEMKVKDDADYSAHVFSMIEDCHLDLKPEWEALFNGICYEDLEKQSVRLASVYAFLAGMSKTVFYIERFFWLWTSMNAYYRYVAGLFVDECKKKGDTDPRILLMPEGEGRCLGLFARLQGSTYDCSVNIKEVITNAKLRYTVENELGKLTEEQIPQLYKETLEAMRGEGHGGVLSDSLTDLKKLADDCGVSLYILLLINYPYSLRNEYFHGNIPAMLVSAYNDYEVRRLYVVNYYLTEFLNQKIPELFSEDFWDESKQRIGEAYWGECVLQDASKKQDAQTEKKAPN